MVHKGQTKNIIISHTYSRDNKGDAALISVLIQEIQRTFQPANIIILTVDRIKPGEKFENVPIKPSFMYSAYSTDGKLIRILSSLFMMITTLIWAYCYKFFKIDFPLKHDLKETAAVYRDADLIIPVGGGYFRTNKKIDSMFGLILLLHPLVLSKILKKPTVLYSQSIGPFYRKSEGIILRRTLNKTINLALIREDKSMQLLKRLGVINIVRSVDAGFLLKSGRAIKIRQKLKLSQNQSLIGVTVRQWLDQSGQEKYEQALAEVIDYLISEYNAYIIFIPQVTVTFIADDDRLTSRSVYERLKHKNKAHVVEESYDHYQIKALYDEQDFIIGTRFHSVIFSLTSYVPALAIEYEHKTSGIMHDLDLDKWVVKIEEVTPHILKQEVDKLIEAKEQYKAHLRVVLPPYIERAKQAIELTSEAYKVSLRK